jgi:hypothetical protein
MALIDSKTNRQYAETHGCSLAQAFVNTRRERAVDIEVTRDFTDYEPQWGKKFLVQSQSRDIKFVVRLGKNHQHSSCGCEDYRNQRETWGKGCCRHMYAALFSLGYTSLLHYFEEFDPCQ